MERLNPSGLLTLDFADLAACADRVAAFSAKTPVDAVVGVDERTAVAAAAIAARLHLPHNTVDVGGRCRQQGHHATAAGRRRGLPRRGTGSFRRAHDPRAASGEVAYPCVLKPTFLAASRGVIRADDPPQFVEAWGRIVAHPPGAGGRCARRRRRRGDSRRGLRARRGGRAGRPPDGRSAPGARALRQAGPARRAVFRGDDLRDAFAPPGGGARGLRECGPGSGAGPRAEGRPDARRIAGRRRDDLGHRDRGALDRRPLLADAAVRNRDEPRGADPASRARAPGPGRADARRARQAS